MDITALNALLKAVPPSIPPNTPITMLNLLRFHPKAQYPRSSPHFHESKTGREAYMAGYIPTFSALAAKDATATGAPLPGFELVYMGAPHGTLVGPADEEWDVVALVRYSDIEVFRRVVGSAEYAETALVHREAGLMDWRLVVSSEMGL